MAEEFSGAAWSNPESDMESADDYCSVCLIDLNEPGQPKTKANCKLPVRSTPGGPINKNAMIAAAGALAGARGGVDAPAAAKRAAARKLVRMYGMAQMEAPDMIKRMGM